MDLLWEMGLFCSWNRKEFIGFYWTVIEFIWVRAEANEIFFFFFHFFGHPLFLRLTSNAFPDIGSVGRIEKEKPTKISQQVSK